MSDTNSVAGTEIRYPGYFWRRVVAFFVDGIIFGAVFGLLGVILFGPTDGKIRVGSMLFSVRSCAVPQIDLANLNLPKDFRVTHAVSCTFTFWDTCMIVD